MTKQIEVNWTDDDIDAAYIMGFISAFEFDDSNVMDRLQKELTRLKVIDKTPSQIISEIRNK